MSVHATPATSSVSYDGCGEEDRGYGWVILAGGLLLLGTLNAIEGLAAIGNDACVPALVATIFAIDIVAVYGLGAYGKRIGEG
jgi:hypothetical protein